jgi:predicted DNA-binding ribbon-helix-helix protein
MSSVVKRSVVLLGRKTSISLEQPFWDAFRAIASEKGVTLTELLDEIDSQRKRNCNLSSAIRMFVLAYYIPRDRGCGAPPGHDLSPWSG